MSTVVWIVIGMVILAALSGSKGKGSKSAGSKGQPPGLIIRMSFQMMRANALSVGNGSRGRDLSVLPAVHGLQAAKTIMKNLTRKRTSWKLGTRRKDCE